MLKSLGTFACGVAVATALAVVTPALAQEPEQGGSINVGLADDAKSLDPTYQINFSERQPLYLIYNTLFKLGTDFSIQPELATDWSYSDDGLTMTLTIREGVKFHDGTTLDAEAVKWNIEHRMDPDVSSPSASALNPVIESVEAPDATTVIIHLKTVAPALPGMLAQREGFIISPTAAEELGDSFGVNPVGSGPFIFKEWALNRIVLDKNPDYWEEGKPYLDNITFHLITDATSALPRLMTGELDSVVQLSPFDIRALEGRDGVAIYPSPGARWVTLQTDTKSEALSDKRVRQAITYGLDREKIVQIVTAGKAKLANGPTPPGLWWYNPDLPKYPHDPGKAKELLAEAGYPDGLKLTLSVPPVSMYRPLSQLAQEQLKEIGIDLTISPVSRSEWVDLLMNHTINFLPIRWTQRPDPDGMMSLLLDSSSSQNTSRYESAEFDEVMAKARAATDMETRKQLYFKAQEILSEDLPYINLFFNVEYAALASDVHGFEWIPDEIPRYREIWKEQ